jgi:hypothetical protein
MQNSAKQVEGMVRMKMEQREYIILCLEDTNDWSNATTRRLVMQVPAVLLVIYIALAVKQGTVCVAILKAQACILLPVNFAPV